MSHSKLRTRHRRPVSEDGGVSLQVGQRAIGPADAECGERAAVALCGGEPAAPRTAVPCGSVPAVTGQSRSVCRTEAERRAGRRESAGKEGSGGRADTVAGGCWSLARAGRSTAAWHLT